MRHRCRASNTSPRCFGKGPDPDGLNCAAADDEEHITSANLAGAEDGPNVATGWGCNCAYRQHTGAFARRRAGKVA